MAKKKKNKKKIDQKRLLFIAIGIVAVLLAGFFLFKGDRTPEDVLSINLREHKNLALHMHPIVEIEILGESYPIPANMGVSQEGMRVIHTHDDTGKLHIESPVPHQFYLKDFFAIWGKRFDRECIMDHCADDQHELNVYVNGAKSGLYGDVAFQDGDKIKIEYVEKQ